MSSPRPGVAWEPWELGDRTGWQLRIGPVVVVWPDDDTAREIVAHVIEEPTRTRLAALTLHVSRERAAKLLEAAARTLVARRTGEVQIVGTG